MDKKERIELLRKNLETNKEKFDNNMITKKQFTIRKKDVLRRISELESE